MSWMLAIAALIMAMIPCAIFFRNLPLFCSSHVDQADRNTNVSVLIPARNEAKGIRLSIGAALASEGVTVEVVVLDDHSTDDTPTIVRAMKGCDDRVRLIQSKELPSGWNGKQHACTQLGEAASYDLLLFIDADVRLTATAISELVNRKQDSGVALLSAFPHQETGTVLEKWLIPMMHYILLCFLPFDRMRESHHPAYASGCGQLFLTTKEDYITAGTHAAIRESRHDGIKLPRAFRQAGLMTDVVDGTLLANCRMYVNGPQVIRGVLKNATEGIANPKLIVPFTVILLGANLLPAVALWICLLHQNIGAAILAGFAIVLAHGPRLVAAIRFRQSWLGVFCHIPATVLFVLLQWIALLIGLMGRQIAWRGRI